MTHTGSCLCGKISYEFDGEPAMAGICHCLNCQKQGGSAFSTIAGVAKDAFRMNGAPKLYLDKDTVSGNPVERFFCGDCGSPIYSGVSGYEDTVFLKTGTLDDTSDFQPQFHAWCSTKQKWVALDEDVPQMPN